MAIEVNQVAGKVQDALDEYGINKNWTRGLVAGSLITGAVLLASGKRKAGLAVTAVGAIVALLEDAGNVQEVWEKIPGYLQNGQQMLSQLEHFVVDLAQQGERIRKLISQASA